MSRELFEKCLLVDVVEATLDIGIIHKLRFVSNSEKDCSYGIVTGPSGSKPIAIGFKHCFPLGFECHLCEGLFRAFSHRWDAKRSLFGFSWLWYPDSTNGSGFVLSPVFWVDAFGHGKASFRVD